MLTISIARARRTAFYEALDQLKNHLSMTGTSALIVHLMLAADAHQLAAPAVLTSNASVSPEEEPEQTPTKMRVSIPISIPAQKEKAFARSLEQLQQQWPSSSASALIVSLVINTAALIGPGLSAQHHPGDTLHADSGAMVQSIKQNGLAWIAPDQAEPHRLMGLWGEFHSGQSANGLQVAYDLVRCGWQPQADSPAAADWLSRVFQYVAVLLLDAEHYDMALDSAQLAVTYAEDAIQRQAVDAGIFIAALIRRALVHLHMSLHTKSSTMQTYFREQAENDLTTALQQAESGYPLLKAEAEAGLGDVLARLSGDVTRAFALFEQALAYAPTEVTVDRHGFLTSRAMIVCRRAQAMLYLHAQQATRDQVHGSLAAGERDIQEALHMVPPLQRRGYLDLLVTQFECALARKRPDEAMRIAHELAFWLAKKPAGLQRITARYHHGMQRLHTSHPDLFELAA